MPQYVRTSEIHEVRRFIRDLKEVLKKAERTGGGHSAFLHNTEEDRVLLQIEVALKVRSKK